MQWTTKKGKRWKEENVRGKNDKRPLQHAVAECQHRGRERDGIEKGQVDAKKSEKEKRGDKNGKI